MPDPVFSYFMFRNDMIFSAFNVCMERPYKMSIPIKPY